MSIPTELYTRAKNAKTSIDEKLKSDDRFLNIQNEDKPSIARILHDIVACYTYDERCVVAAGVFQNWDNRVEFQMPSTERVAEKMSEKDSKDCQSFVAVAYRWIEKTDGNNGRRLNEHHRVSIFSNGEKS